MRNPTKEECTTLIAELHAITKAQREAEAKLVDLNRAFQTRVDDLVAACGCLPGTRIDLEQARVFRFAEGKSAPNGGPLAELLVAEPG